MGEDEPGYETILIDCACGRRLRTSEDADRLHCDCGRTFALTLTELAGPTDDEADPDA